MDIIDIIQIIANIATTLAVLLLVRQVQLARHALKLQVRSTELEAFIDVNIKFLELTEKFGEHINDLNICERELTPEERRAIDRYFYLANMEYILYKEKVISESLSTQWLRGIESSATRPVFVERWRSTASKFTLDNDFCNFFEKSIAKAKKEQKA